SQPSVAGGRHTSIVLSDVADAWIVSDNARAVVRRAIVHDDGFDRRIALGEHTLDRLSQKTGSVIAWNDDRDKWCSHIVTVQSRYSAGSSSDGADPWNTVPGAVRLPCSSCSC